MPSIEIVQGSHQALHPGRTAELRVGGRTVGYAGELLPALAEEADLPRVVAVAELDLDAVIALTDPAARGAARSARCPAATQDLSLVGRRRRAGGRGRRRRCATARASSSSTSRSSTTTAAPGVPEGTKSLTFALRFRAPDRTLTAAEASEAKLAGAALAAERMGAAVRE